MMTRLRGSAIFGLLAFATLAVGGSIGCGGEFHGVTEQPVFQTPLAEAEAEGITPYWLGEEFEAGDLTFEITAGSDVHRRPGAPIGFEFTYGADLQEGGRLVFDIESFNEASTDNVQASVTSERPSLTSEEVQVGTWPGDVFTFGGGNRPTNTVLLFVDLGDATVMALAGAGSSGVPGDDVNPLIDSELLIEVLTEHLRPYPE